jgi:hypothetical protein
LDVGRTKRLATPAQERAVIARDRRCVFGCNSPPDWCEVHHNHPWENGGLTNIENLSLVCKQHHHLVHEGGWSLRRVDGVLEIRRPDGTLFDTRARPAAWPRESGCGCGPRADYEPVSAGSAVISSHSGSRFSANARGPSS